MNDKIDWRRKLSSRKFWLALIGFITPVMYLFNVAEGTVETVSAIIMSGASLIAYIFAEGFIDGKEVESKLERTESIEYVDKIEIYESHK